MIKSHINAIENILIAQSKTDTNAGHPKLGVLARISLGA